MQLVLVNHLGGLSLLRNSMVRPTDCQMTIAATWPYSRVGSTSDSTATGPRFDTRSGHIISFLLPLIQEGRFSVTGEKSVQKVQCTG